MAKARSFTDRLKHAFAVPRPLRAPLALVMPFALGLALGGALLGGPALTQAESLTVKAAAPLPMDHVVALAADRVATPVVIAPGKRALKDAPPRMVFAEITLPAAPLDLGPAFRRGLTPERAPIVVASGKSGLLALASLGDVPIRDTRPAIALVIDDLGVVPDRSAHALRLPKEVTLSFLPYGGVSRPLAQAASAKGHEIFLHVPMEPRGDADPGPDALRTADSDRRLRSKLDRQIADISEVAPIAGMNNHMGSRATADRRLMAEVMRGAAERGFVFVDSVTTPHSVARAAAARHDVPFLARDIFLDHGEGPDFLLAQLDTLEQQARARGVAVAIAHPHETSLEILDIWVKGLEAKGLRLVPVTKAIEIEARRSLLAMVQ
ncbi:divergent polysaccharide deacetylase family protein [Pyruvatibacter mobilis]|uniref:divergent polysaccharide deacetylase family protein n=1 Tax=Pyruvatibacter mobilis TaxID=1712261 RepID=UPI003BAD49A0